MKTIYFEMIGGASGNMLLGAMIDAGADAARIETALRTIPVDGWSSESRRVVKPGLAATYYDFVVPGEDHHRHEHAGAHGHARHLAEVLDIVEGSGLSRAQRDRARAIYLRLAEAEAIVHGTTADRIHFHEVGAVDAILDVAATCVALDLLEVDSVWCSAFPVGHGTIDMEHGRYPNPPPTTAELLRGSPTYDAGIAGEMVTPTGAAILTELVARPGVRPQMIAEAIGYGAGRSDFEVPNVLRASVGVLCAGGSSRDAAGDEVVVLEANVDDMSPQRFELALERVLAAGAFDVWLAPVTMKKSRPAILFGASAPLELEAAIAHVMLAETTTLGVRVRRERRYTLPRETVAVSTPFGEVRVKTAQIDGTLRRTLEYDDVVRIARERERPFAEIAARIEESMADGE
ncbi:MAG: nickel pincer cofactor biosynthesis protein LarC [Candidatus Eremiobacteraeota bacterium]|nr:nickel pincer cofactor biosynthesis protein LarC [Candidatus Eremiobacteraeota bacterium]